MRCLRRSRHAPGKVASWLSGEPARSPHSRRGGLDLAGRGRSAGEAGAAPPQNAIAPADALKRLLEGNARYAANAPNERDFSAGRAARAQGQAPVAAILSCADSRVAPELAFDQQPGDIFVLRVAGNIVNNDLLASIEDGVQFLGAPLVMVLGHSSCGAVDAAIKVLKDKAELPGTCRAIARSSRPCGRPRRRRRRDCSPTRRSRTCGARSLGSSRGRR